MPATQEERGTNLWLHIRIVVSFVAQHGYITLHVLFSALNSRQMFPNHASTTNCKFVCPMVPIQLQLDLYLTDRTTTYKANSRPQLHIGNIKWYKQH